MIGIKNILSTRKNRIIILSAIIALAFILRLIGLYKAGGFWYDEAYSYYIAKQPFPFGILEKLYNEDAHAPLYFFLLHLWMKIFGIHDVIIRLLSVIFGLLIIPIFYLLGKEILSREAGIIIALCASLNSFLIYYSQEVRFYSLATLFGALSILFLIKISKNPKIRNYAGFIICNLCLLYTLTISFIFIFAEGLLFLIYLFLKNRSRIRDYIIAQLIVIILYIPYLSFIIHQHDRCVSIFLNPFKVFLNFNYASMLLLFQSWFSPVYYNINIIAPNLTYYEEILTKGITGDFIVFAIMPVLIALTGIILALFRKNFIAWLLSIGVLVICIEIIMTFMGQIAIVSRYLTMVFPIFLVAMVIGLLGIKKKLIPGLLISFFVLSNLYYLVFYPNSAPKLRQLERYKTAGDLLKRYDFDKTDILLTFPGPKKFLSKYYPISNINILDLDTDDIVLRTNNNKILDKKLVSKLNEQTAHDNLRYYLVTDKIPFTLENYIKQEVVDKLDEDSKFIVMLQLSTKPFNENLLRRIALNDEIYKSLSLYFMLTSKFAINMDKIERKYFQVVETKEERGWEIKIMKKKPILKS